MSDLEDHLVPTDVLRAILHEVSDQVEASATIKPKGPAAEALALLLVADHFAERLPAAFRDEPMLFYTKVYWFNRFLQRWKTDHDADAGLEQQAFQILDLAPDGVDWNIVGEIIKRAERSDQDGEKG